MERQWQRFVRLYCAALLFLGCLVFGYDLYRLVYQPLLPEGHAPVIIHLEKATTASSFTSTLKSKHLIRSRRLFLFLIRLQGLSHHLQAGIYQIEPGESPQQFLSKVVAGDVLKKKFRIIEGTTQYQVDANLKRAEYLIYHNADWLSLKASYPSTEGLLLADTYSYAAGSMSKDLLTQAFNNLQSFLEYCWQHRDQRLPYKTSYELLIAASILEKETAKSDERRLISGVIINRLRKNMPLQMDPTVIYGLGEKYQGVLTHHDMQIDSPYNSYRYRGLPPTPIAMVGKDAIEAAAHPEFTRYLYFVAKGDGSHHFSETYEQQKQAIARYLRKKNETE